MRVSSWLGRHGSMTAITGLITLTVLFVIAWLPTSAVATTSAPDGLRPLAEAAQFHLGAAVDADALGDDAYRQLLDDNVTMVSTTDELSFAVVQPERGTFDFSRAEQIVDFAVEAGMTVRGHDLVAPASLPAWITTGTWTPEELRRVLTEHIDAVITHFAERNPGVVTQWDVVANAVISDGSRRPSTLQNVIGDDYVAAAFTAAHAADPDAELFYDDFYDDFSITQDMATSGGAAAGGANGERTTCDQVAKCVGVETMITGLVDAQVPIGGVGFQAHLFSPDPVDFAQFSTWVEDLDLRWAITEFDVPLPATEGSDAATLVYQADEYGAVLDACLSSSACDTFITWGITDRVPTSTGDETGGAFGASLPFDVDDAPKPAVDAIASALDDHAVAAPEAVPTTQPAVAATTQPVEGEGSGGGDTSPVLAAAIGLGALAAVGLIIVALRRRRS